MPQMVCYLGDNPAQIRLNTGKRAVCKGGSLGTSVAPPFSVERRMGGFIDMINLRTTVGGIALSLLVMFAAVSPASAQRRWRDRDRDMSNGAKAGVIAGGAVAGAVIGGLLKGKTGAVVGGLIGGGAGTGYVLLKDRNDNDDRWRGRNRGFANRGSFINRSSFIDRDYYYRGSDFRNGVRNRDCDDRGFRGFGRRR